MATPLFTFLLLLSVLFGEQSSERPGHIEPAAPVWNQPLEITYDTSVRPGGAAPVLNPDGRAMAHLIFIRPDQSEDCLLVALNAGEDGVLRGEAVVPEGAAELTCYFFDPLKPHSFAGLFRERIEVAIEASPGIPAPGASVVAMRRRFPSDDELEAELARYPGSVRVYGTRWGAMEVALNRGEINRDRFAELVREDLKRLADRPADAATASVLPYGLALLGAGTEAVAALERLMENYPGEADLYETSMYTLAALMESIGPDAPECERIWSLFIAHCTRHPSSPLAVRGWRDALDRGLPFATSLEIFLACEAEDPGHPDALLALAIACDRSGLRLEEGMEASRRAIRMYENGERRLRQMLGPRDRVDIIGNVSQIQLPVAYAALAGLLHQAGRFEEAVEAAGAVRRCEEARPGDVALSWLAEGRSLMALDRPEDAEQALLRAHLKGATAAAGELRALHQARGGDPKSFEQELAAAARLIDLGEGKELPPAPKLVGKTLAGMDVSLEALRGKVVVINFWFLACAPCRSEMPALNRLVDAYEGREDVVFLSIATDPEAKLREFAAKEQFKYLILPDSGRALSKAYKVSAFPTHVIITPEGRVVHRLEGACHDPLGVLGPIIDWAAGRPRDGEP